MDRDGRWTDRWTDRWVERQMDEYIITATVVLQVFLPGSAPVLASNPGVSPSSYQTLPQSCRFAFMK